MNKSIDGLTATVDKRSLGSMYSSTLLIQRFQKGYTKS